MGVVMNSEKSNSATVVLVQSLIQDLVNTGMSYSRISKRLGLSPSTMQKIVTKNRMPRIKTIIDIGNYYIKIFESPQSYGESTMNYYLKNSEKINNKIFCIKRLLLVLISK